MSGCKPLIKWPGGKRQLLGSLNKYVPEKFNKYIEPFFGGGAVFFDLSPHEAIINDINGELMNFYNVLRNNPKGLIDSVSKYKVSENDYYRIRSYDVNKLSEIQRASRFMYLNKNCFNGLYRVNKEGNFNVPYAGYIGRAVYDVNEIYFMSEILQRAQILNVDFKNLLNENAKEGDFIFLDPPYLPDSTTAMFNRYNPDIFSLSDHQSLALIVAELEKKGCHILMTSSCNQFVEGLYPQMNIEYVQVRRSISCNGKTRTGTELIIASKSLARNYMRALA